MKFPTQLTTLGLLGLWSCSPATLAFRLDAPSPEIVRFKIMCEKSMKACESRAKKACAGPYTTLSSTASRTKPKRITSEPSPRSVGPRYQHERWYGTLLIDCHGDTKPPTSTSGTASSHTTAPAIAPATERLCVPGATQACLGAGACGGAQACNPAGLGYLPCDCGTMPTPMPTPATVPTVPAVVPANAPAVSPSAPSQP